MVSIITAIITASTVLAAAVYSAIPIINRAPASVLPFQNINPPKITCVTSSESEIWSSIEISLNLPQVANAELARDPNNIFTGSEVVNPGTSTASRPINYATVGPPTFPASCNSGPGIAHFYKPLRRLIGNVPDEASLTFDVVVYGVAVHKNTIHYCDGYHQCNAVP